MICCDVWTGKFPQHFFRYSLQCIPLSITKDPIFVWLPGVWVLLYGGGVLILPSIHPSTFFILWFPHPMAP